MKYEQENIVKIKTSPVGRNASVLFTPDDFYCSLSSCFKCRAKVQAANDRVKFYRKTLSE